ncbi:WD repeat-containing protein [Stanieria cyanosphaera PCC 7437]|uniref:WD repeat-containing protein n=1 Tax=Stanieria cyanosphaera (strain ATCC 29371 / PCC 7437) TaxID=111780 RepID=K9XMH9_STAC7|nr:hypothetical protein [Stanieria cyanosphaera]AFZ33810.1 WD repeat-containing protein [Stanieria cyanosphaera PCC 7437]
MALFVDQLVYTSFPEIGFKLLTSGQITPQLQQLFLELVVDRCWNAYQPPPPGYQAAFLRQIDADNSFFGWLKSDINDDFERINVPYFLGYYCDRPLTAQQLNNIFNCLQRGPLSQINRHDLLFHSLEPVYIPDFNGYQSAGMEMKISPVIRQHSLVVLQQNQLLNLLIPTQPSSINPLEIVLRNAIAEKMGISGAVLITQTGELLTKPISLERKTQLILTNIIKNLNPRELKQNQAQTAQKILLQGRNGYLVLFNCYPDIFLLIKAELILKSVLQKQIDSLINQLQPELNKLQLKLYCQQY